MFVSELAIADVPWILENGTFIKNDAKISVDYDVIVTSLLGILRMSNVLLSTFLSENFGI